MDMDPCVVASRSESVVYKVDLTASEHAGVTLSESTTLVSGQDYPKVAKVEPSNDDTRNKPSAHQPNWCGDKCFDTHIERKQHQTNLKISEKTLASNTGDGNGNKIKWCEICKISCATNIYDTHASGKKHKRNLQNLDKIPNLPSTVTDSATPLEGKDVNPIEGNSTSCEVCGIFCNSLDMLNKHIAGKKHQKNLKNFEKHQEGKIVFLEGTKRKTGDSLSSSDEDADTKRQKMNEEEASGVLVSCKVCNVGCIGFTAFEAHLASFEHSAMVLKQAEGGQAGVTLTEHATHVAPQALNNVAVTKTETKNNNFIAFDSEKAFEKHMEGKIHLITTQKLNGSSTVNQETPSPVASDMLNQKPEKKKNQELDNITQNLIVTTIIEQETPSSVANDTLDQQKEARAESLFVCAIPEPGQIYKKIATVEVDESLFKNPIPIPAKHRVHQPPVWCDICKVSCSGNCFDLHVVGKQHQKNLKISEKATTIHVEESKSIESENKIIWCEICKVNCSSVAYDKHESGKKHIKNVKKLEKIPSLPSTVAEKQELTKGEVVDPNERNSTSCELCGIHCTTLDVLNKHLVGKRHQKKLKRTAIEGKVVILEESKRKVNGSLSNDDGSDTKRQKMNEEEEEANGILVTCKVCNVGCTGFTAYETHLAGFEHIAMALKLAQGGSMGKV